MSDAKEYFSWWYDEEEEAGGAEAGAGGVRGAQPKEESIITKVKPIAIVSEQPTIELIARLAPGEYVAWQKPSGFIDACVQASSVDNERIEFECPFCSQYRNKNGTRKCRPMRRTHAHGSLGDRTQRIEDRCAHCVAAAVGGSNMLVRAYGFQIYITENTKGVRKQVK